MSQNQSYFWQTTKRNVYLKRSAKLHLLLAFMSVLTYATICEAEIQRDINENHGIAMEAPLMPVAEKQIDKAEDIANELPNNDASVKDKTMQSGFVDAFTASISVILFTELGDKTFFIAAIMAMRHPRLIVFSGAISALALMTVLSVVFGMAATIIPKIYTYYISTALFAIFGLKMIYDGYVMKPTDAQEELEEVQSDLRKREDELNRKRRSNYDDIDSKRKNSNSDKDTTESSVNNSGATTENRQLKQRMFKKNNTKMEESDEHDTFLNDAAAGSSKRGDSLKMSTFVAGSPGLSSTVSNETNQTNFDDFLNDSPNKFAISGSMPNENPDRDSSNPMHNNNSQHDLAMANASVPSSSGTLNKSSSKHSINSINSLALHSPSAAGQSNGELKQVGTNKKRLERDVTATLVQDPESGMVRKSGKKGPAYLTMRVFMQAFTMTFLAEWGDRSQLTTIILAASKNVYGVIVGGVIGHSICTGLAVIGGRMVAAKISVRTVTIVGGIVFLGFALYALIVRPDDI